MDFDEINAMQIKFLLQIIKVIRTRTFLCTSFSSFSAGLGVHSEALLEIESDGCILLNMSPPKDKLFAILLRLSSMGSILLLRFNKLSLAVPSRLLDSPFDGELNKARLHFNAWGTEAILGIVWGTKVEGASLGFLFSGLIKRARFDVSRVGNVRLNESESKSNLRIAFFLLELPVCVLGVLIGVFLPGVFLPGVLRPGTRFSLGLFLSLVYVNFLCGKKL